MRKQQYSIPFTRSFSTNPVRAVNRTDINRSYLASRSAVHELDQQLERGRAAGGEKQGPHNGIFPKWSEGPSAKVANFIQKLFRLVCIVLFDAGRGAGFEQPYLGGEAVFGGA